MATVLILLDAFRRDYLAEHNTPFLWSCSREGEHYKGVIQSFGFCERSEILTGKNGDESGFLTAIGFDPDASPYRGTKLLHLFDVAERCALSLLKLAPKTIGTKIHKRLRSYVQRYFHRCGITMPSFLIPYPWLRCFALTEDRVDHRQSNAFASPSILNRLTDSGKTYYYDSFTALGLPHTFSSDQQRLDAVVEDLKRGPKDLYLVYVSVPDSQGHRYGPDALELHAQLADMDQMVERFAEQAEQAASGNTYLFVGDHGMLTVTDHFDAESAIKQSLQEAGLKPGKDVIHFLDSTMVRVWAVSDRAREQLPDLLNAASQFAAHGKWLDTDAAKRLQLPWPDRRYGDHLWMANPGVQVFPDFFHRISPCKGMHGYDPQLPESQGTCIRWGKDIQPNEAESIRLAEVHNILEESLGL